LLADSIGYSTRSITYGKLAYVTIAVAGAARNARRIGADKKREPYTTQEDIQTAVQVTEAEVQIPAIEYMQ